MTSYQACNKTSLSRKPCIPDKTLLWNVRYQEVMVALSESVIKMRPKRPLTEKSWRRHIRLAIKPRHPWNHACQMKSYWGSNGRFIRICHENSPEAPPSEEITMTSYPSCNETSLYRKPCIPDKKLLWKTMRKSRSQFQNPSWKIAWSAPRQRNHDDVIYYL